MEAATEPRSLGDVLDMYLDALFKALSDGSRLERSINRLKNTTGLTHPPQADPPPGADLPGSPGQPTVSGLAHSAHGSAPEGGSARPPRVSPVPGVSPLPPAGQPRGVGQPTSTRVSPPSGGSARGVGGGSAWGAPTPDVSSRAAGKLGVTVNLP